MKYSLSKLLCKGLLIACTALMFFPSTSQAQGGASYFNPRDDQYKLLGLKRAMDAYDYAKSEFERKEKLFKDKAIPTAELDAARRTFNAAEVDFQQNILAVVFENQYVSITRAIKYSRERSESMVTITLENTSGSSAELGKLVNIDDSLFLSLEPDVVNNIYVSLLNDDNAIISKPYEQKIARLTREEPIDITFALLEDLDSVTVNILYGSGSQIQRKIILEKDSSVDKVEIRSDQFSQEVELGKSAKYDLSLELFSGSNDTFKLEVYNLPDQINRYFTNTGTETRLSQIRYTESSNTLKATLQVFLPDRPNQNVVIDESREFFVVSIPQDRASEPALLTRQGWTEERLREEGLGFLKLDLVPRGVGELLVRARQLFFSVDDDTVIEVPIELVNEGSRTLNNVEIRVEAPLNWTYEILPRTLPSLDIFEEQNVTLLITPADDVAAGRYEVRVRSRSLSDEQPIEGEDKSVTIEIKPDVNIGGTLLVLILVLGLVVGLVVFGVKLSRR